MKITRFIINENGEIILTAVTEGEINFIVGEIFKLMKSNSTYLFKVTSIEAKDERKLICTMKETGDKKNRMYQYLLDPRQFIGYNLFKVDGIDN